MSGSAVGHADVSGAVGHADVSGSLLVRCCAL